MKFERIRDSVEPKITYKCYWGYELSYLFLVSPSNYGDLLLSKDNMSTIVSEPYVLEDYFEEDHWEEGIHPILEQYYNNMRKEAKALDEKFRANVCNALRNKIQSIRAKITKCEIKIQDDKHLLFCFTLTNPS